jgi:hypothetical protein
MLAELMVEISVSVPKVRGRTIEETGWEGRYAT